MSTTLLTDVLDYIMAYAQMDDLERIKDAARQRQLNLGSLNAIMLRKGDRVETHGLSPKYLNGLTGTVEVVKGKRVDVTLDKHAAIAITGTKHGPKWGDVTDNFVLRGIPTLCIKEVRR